MTNVEDISEVVSAILIDLDVGVRKWERDSKNEMVGNGQKERERGLEWL